MAKPVKKTTVKRVTIKAKASSTKKKPVVRKSATAKTSKKSLGGWKKGVIGAVVVVAILAGFGVIRNFTRNTTDSDAATSTLVTIEAENMAASPAANSSVFSDSAASGGKAVLGSNAAVTWAATTTASASSELRVTARGDQCSGAPNMTVKLDGTSLGTTAVTATGWTSYTYPATIAAGTHKVEISFTNPYTGYFWFWSSCVRGLRVDKTSFTMTTADPIKMTSDATLLSALKRELGTNYYHNVAAAFIDLNNASVPVKYATIGSINSSTQFEIASISKTMLGHLFADAISRGEVTPDQKLGTILPVPSSSPVYNITLQQLATHTSGLPSVSTGSDWTNAYNDFTTKGTDPYIFSTSQMIQQAVNSFVPSQVGTYTYSNMGAGLLGQALATKAGMPYETLMKTRLFTPTGMTNAYMPITASGLLPGSMTGFDANGRSVNAWTMNGYAPAGGVRASINDMATYAMSVLKKNQIGMDAVNPKFTVSSRQSIGWLWNVWDVYSTRDWLEHLGQTGGFCSYIGVDRYHGHAMVVLSDTSVLVDKEGINLLNSNGT